MKNTVSYQTASRLKAAGFPQPEPESGQVWHEGNMPYVIGGFNDGKLSGAYFHGAVFFEVEQDAMEKDIFAPTATDILEQLPSTANISKPFNAELWICVYGENEDDWTESDNHAEAAAAAWLVIHEKKAFTPNARIKFVRDQIVECYDERGKQRVLVIENGRQYDAVFTDEKVTIESPFGLITLPRKEAFFLTWL